MKSPKEKGNKKTYLVISDIHLGAGKKWQNNPNPLEDFHKDNELVSFLKFYQNFRDVELIINGDFFDLLAVPYVNYFDDEFWREDACLEKLKIILEGHREVFEALIDFVSRPYSKITYIIGNHDAELIIPSLQNYFLSFIPHEYRGHFVFKLDQDHPYFASKKIAIKHGHEYEFPHCFNQQDSLCKDDEGRIHFVPPWGSVYVSRIVNKFKEEQDYVNQIKPVSTLVFRGLLKEPLFILRFIVSTCFFFFMVRFLSFIKESGNILGIYRRVQKELKMFHCLEEEVTHFFEDFPETRVLVLGHTHEIYQKKIGTKTVLNPGTWTQMDITRGRHKRRGTILSYALIREEGDSLDYNLMEWKIDKASIYLGMSA